MSDTYNKLLGLVNTPPAKNPVQKKEETQEKRNKSTNQQNDKREETEVNKPESQQNDLSTSQHTDNS